MYLRQTKSWRRKYIRSLVSLAGAWGGTVVSLESLLSKSFSWVSWYRLSLDVQTRHFESPYWLMPAKDAFGDEIVATVNLTSTDRNRKVKLAVLGEDQFYKHKHMRVGCIF